MTTHTFALLEISDKAYNELSEKLRAAGYDHVFMDDGAIDMHGIGVIKAEQRDPARQVINHEEQIALSSFLTRKVKEFDPEKGVLSVWVQQNVRWWFENLAKGEIHE